MENLITVRGLIPHGDRLFTSRTFPGMGGVPQTHTACQLPYLTFHDFEGQVTNIIQVFSSVVSTDHVRFALWLANAIIVTSQ